MIIPFQKIFFDLPLNFSQEDYDEIISNYKYNSPNQKLKR